MSRLERISEEWSFELGPLVGSGYTSVVYDAGPEQVLKVG